MSLVAHGGHQVWHERPRCPLQVVVVIFVAAAAAGRFEGSVVYERWERFQRLSAHV